MATDGALFTPDELADWVGEDVSQERGERVESVVWSWLAAPLGRDERPSPVPDVVLGWALELGGIALANPAALKSQRFGDVAETYDRERAESILGAAARRFGGQGPLARPRGRFPKPACQPDPPRF